MTTGTPKLHVGIDYSLTSPAITECLGEWKYENVKHYCIVQTDKQLEKWHSAPNIRVSKYPKYNTEMQRYCQLADWTVNSIVKFNNRPKTVFIEDYAYAATGRVFTIGENMAILKYFLTDWGIRYQMVPPTVIKKYASGKGNANKELMHDSFMSDTRRNLSEEFQTKHDKNPVSDIVDSYWVCKYGYEHGTNT